MSFNDMMETSRFGHMHNPSEFDTRLRRTQSETNKVCPWEDPCPPVKTIFAPLAWLLNLVLPR